MGFRNTRAARPWLDEAVEVECPCPCTYVHALHFADRCCRHRLVMHRAVSLCGPRGGPGMARTPSLGESSDSDSDSDPPQTYFRPTSS